MPLMLRKPLAFFVSFAAMLIVVAFASLQAAHAVSIELRDEAPDRIERQRAAAIGNLPLPGTPDTSQFPNRLAAAGLKSGLPMLIRIFKAESELEVWMEKDGAYVLFATYPICHWSGTLGPKIREGDKQTPEGFYTITSRQLHRLGRWTRALNLGFPNAYDESLKRDGSYILVHGGCSSVGCFAMTNPVIEEVYSLTSAALRGGQRHVPVHVFPFRMTEANLARHKDAEWYLFWQNLKEGFDAFERTKRPPYVSVCDGHYRVEEMSAGSSPSEEGAPGPLAVCGPTAAALLDSDKSAWLVPLGQKFSVPQPLLAPIPWMQTSRELPLLQSILPAPVDRGQSHLLYQPGQPPEQTIVRPPLLVPKVQSQPEPSLLTLSQPAPATAQMGELKTDPLLVEEARKAASTIDPALTYELVPRLVAPAAKTAQSGIRERELPCSLRLASCRKYAALLSGRSKTRLKVASQSRVKTASRLR